jgi:large subunit ribosomal protein L13
MKTYHAKPGEVQREWLVVDATDIPLGRLASAVATLLRGKHKPQFTPHVDTGDFVIVVNAAKIGLTGNKAAQETKARHSGFQGGRKEVSFGELLEKNPERLVEGAVKGMLPHNTLGRATGKKLKVYAGPDHKHEAQNPRTITLEV